MTSFRLRVGLTLEARGRRRALKNEAVNHVAVHAPLARLSYVLSSSELRALADTDETYVSRIAAGRTPRSTSP